MAQEKFMRWGAPSEPLSRWARSEDDLAPPAARIESLNSIKAEGLPMPLLQVRHFQAAAFLAGRVRAAYGSVAAMERSGRNVKCMVIPYGVVTNDIGGFSEMYRRGSFRDSVAADDIRALINNNLDKVLGRVSAGTLRVTDEPDGVHLDVDVPETSFGDDLLVSMGRGDIDQCTAAFFILEHSWTNIDGQRVRVIERGRLVVASISSFGLFQDVGTDSQQAVEDARAAGYRQALLDLRKSENGQKAAPTAQAKRRLEYFAAQRGAGRSFSNFGFAGRNGRHV